MKKTLFCCILLMIGLAGCKTKETAAMDWKPNEEVRKHIAKVIVDAERRQAMLGIMDSFDAEMQAIFDAVKAQRAKIVEANANYDTTRADLEKMYAELNGQAGQLGDTAKKHSFELRKHCSESEWKKIFTHAKHEKINYL